MQYATKNLMSRQLSLHQDTFAIALILDNIRLS